MKRKGILYAVVLSAVAAGFGALARAEIYRWVDEDGQMRVSTEPPPTGVGGKVKVTGKAAPKKASLAPPRKILHEAGFLTGPDAVYKGPSPAGPASSEKTLSHLQPKAAAKVEIFSAPWCKWCTKTKAFFQERGVAYTEYNVDSDPQAAAKLRTYNPSGGIPVTLINGTPISGYAPKQFESALNPR